MRTLILLSLIAAAFASQPQCGENEHFEECGTVCPTTCANYNKPPRFCSLRCNIGCQCDAGYVRNADGRCVKPEECPSQAEQCGENEHFEECGTVCPTTCANYNKPPRFCSLRCNIGCQCDAGYVRAAHGRCVKPEECPSQAGPVCEENQRHTTCGSACPLTCDNYAKPPKICPAMCFIGCECTEGYVKTRDGRCVRPEDCPSDAPPTVQTCTEKPEKGMCLAYIPSWYYDTETGKCERFIYGGCQGNGNRYPTEEECLAKCQGTGQHSSSDACDLPAEPGVCRGAFPKFYFDRTTGQCKTFIYGGCGGNDNNFESAEECQSTCAAAAPKACLQEKVVGPCRGNFKRFFYNQESGKCEEFVYGGCQGNSNNFHTEADCHAVCSAAAAPKAPEACLQEKVTGPCRGYFKRFFYNQESGECEEFVYGGCQGNSNNFHTKEDCHAVCSA